MEDVVTRAARCCCCHCDSDRTVRHGRTRKGVQRYRCRTCGRSFVRGFEGARLLIAEDNALARECLKAVLAGERDFRVVGEAADGREALGLCYRVRPDVVLMDLRMPGMDGLVATRIIKQRYPDISVLVLTMYENQAYLLEALRAGATGYVLKDASPHEITAAIRKALDGEVELNHALATQLLLQLASGSRETLKPLSELECSEPCQPLTSRELEVLELVALGQTNREIARSLVIGLSTVKRHLENIASRLGVSDRTQAVVRALEQGIIPFPKHRKVGSS